MRPWHRLDRCFLKSRSSQEMPTNLKTSPRSIRLMTSQRCFSLKMGCSNESTSIAALPNLPLISPPGQSLSRVLYRVHSDCQRHQREVYCRRMALYAFHSTCPGCSRSSMRFHFPHRIWSPSLAPFRTIKKLSWLSSCRQRCTRSVEGCTS